MRKRFFLRLFFLYFLILVSAVLFIEMYITNVVRTNYINNLEKSLSVQASLLSEKIPFTSNIDDLCRSLKHIVEARITIIDREGRVLGDSDYNSASMDNHKDRPEIKQALSLGIGWSERYSDTLKKDLLYAARKISRNNITAGFVRLAVPLDKINKSVNLLRLKINSVVIAVFLLMSFFLIWQTERIRKFVHQIIEYSGALAHGIFRERLYLDDAGEFTELTHNLNNMAAELKDNMERIQKESSRLNVIVKSIPDALLLINTSGIIKLANKAALDLFGVAQLYGRSFIEIIRNPDFVSFIDKVKKTRMPVTAEMTLDYPEEKYLSCRLSPLAYRTGDLSGVIAIFNDITHLKKLEQMRRDFVANASHEIKTPVTSIKGFAETLLDGALEDKENAAKFINTIKSQSERLNRLVEDLLVLSNIELGKVSITRADVNISEVIDETMKTMTVQAAEKNLSLKKSVDGEIVLNADLDKLEQVLLNLIDNAIKFTEQGEVEIGIAKDKMGHHLYVRDTGIGVPEQFINRLGERFFRVDASRSRNLGGTGLGLAIVKHIVQAHGWHMNIESYPGKGTIVKIYY